MEINLKVWAPIAGTLLGAAVAWQTLDLPRPALNTEVAEVQQYSRGTRSLQLRSDRRYISDELYRLHRRKKTQPNNPDLDRRIKDMRDDLKDIEEKIKRLK